MKIGYFLPNEEFGPHHQIERALMSEEAGSEAFGISDHYHPRIDEQDQSPLVWSVIGALSQVTALPVTTAVTCPTVRIHPAVIVQVARFVSEGMISESVPCGPDPEPHRQMMQQFIDAGYDEVYVQKIGPNQKQLFDFHEKEILPEFR